MGHSYLHVSTMGIVSFFISPLFQLQLGTERKRQREKKSMEKNEDGIGKTMNPQKWKIFICQKEKEVSFGSATRFLFCFLSFFALSL